MLGHTDEVRSVAFSKDGKFIVSGSEDETIKIWSLDTYECIITLKGHNNSINSLMISSDCKFIVSGDENIKIWSFPDGKLIRTLTGHHKIVNSVAISSDCRVIASGSSDNTVRVWSIASNESQVMTLCAHSDTVASVVFS